MRSKGQKGKCRNARFIPKGKYVFRQFGWFILDLNPKLFDLLTF